MENLLSRDDDGATVEDKPINIIQLGFLVQSETSLFGSTNKIFLYDFKVKVQVLCDIFKQK